MTQRRIYTVTVSFSLDNTLFIILNMIILRISNSTNRVFLLLIMSLKNVNAILKKNHDLTVMIIIIRYIGYRNEI